MLGLVERERAYSTVHEGAVYLHLGEQYLVRQLDLDARAALVAPATVDWYTQAKKETRDGDRGAAARRATARARAPLRPRLGHRAGRRLPAQVDRGRRHARDRAARPARDDASRPRRSGSRPTPRQLDGLEEMPKLLSSLHAAEHSLIALLPLWAMCDRWDIGGLSTNVHFQTGLPTIFVYDGHAGGVGITERGFERFEGWVADTARLLAGCPCADGCPSCVQSPKCGNLNDLLDKDGALTLLRRLLAA